LCTISSISSTVSATDTRYINRVFTADKGEGNGIITTRDLSKVRIFHIVRVLKDRQKIPQCTNQHTTFTLKSGKRKKRFKSTRKGSKRSKGSATYPSLFPSESPFPSESLFPSIHISTWGKLGDDVIGDSTAGDEFGSSICLSKYGTVLAVGERFNNHVRVFELSGEDWIQRGDDFYGAAGGQLVGVSVALRGDGSVVSMGAPPWYNKGHVRVYKWSNKDDGSSEEAWTQKGSTINGEAVWEWSGYSVAMNDYGTVIGIGAPNGGKKTFRSGNVRVFEFVDRSWVQRGQDIGSRNIGDHSGWSISSLDSSGSTIAIGAPTNDGNGDNAGHIRVYDWVD